VIALPSNRSVSCRSCIRGRDHGTSAEYAQTIRTNGIDLSKGSPFSDFGQGFYMTTSKDEALLSASRRYGLDNLDAAKHRPLWRALVALSILSGGRTTWKMMEGSIWSLLAHRARPKRTG